MLKNWKVEAYSQLMDAETYVHSLEDAMDIYEKFKENNHYYHIVVLSNVTGEVVAHYDVEANHDGIEFHEWFSNAVFEI